MNVIERYRQIQLEREALERLVELVNAEIKNHPLKPQPGEHPGEHLEEWLKARASLDRRKESLKSRLLEVMDEKAALNVQWTQSPLPKTSLARVIDRLTEIEARFTSHSAEDAWDHLSIFIDQLEADSNRVNVEEQIATLEAAS